MKKQLLILLGILLLLNSSAFAWFTSLYNRGAPISTYYLGDKLSYEFEFAVNQDSGPMTVSYGLGQATDGTDWSWYSALWSRMDGTNNRVWKSTINVHQFTATGNWYYSGRFVWTADGYTEYASDDWLADRTSLIGTSYFTVLPLESPSNQSATTLNSSQIDLSWEKWSEKNVMIVRNTTGVFTAPNQGTAYLVGNTIGSSTVVYNGADESFSDTGLDPGQTYYYAFYSENYSYYSDNVTANSTTNSNFRSKASGNWSSLTTWEVTSGTSWVDATWIPTFNDDAITIISTHTVTLDINSSSLYLINHGTLNLNDKILSIANGGLIINNSTINSGTSTVVFEGTATIGGTQTTTFNDVTINGGIDFGSSKSIINGTLTINTGSFVNLNAPIYGSSSTLKYNSGGVYERRVEWDNVGTAGTTPGHPVNVLIANNTTIDYPNTGTNAFTTDLEIAGNLTIDAGSQLIMAYGYNNNKSGSLTIGGDLIINGNLGLGDAINGDIILKGDWIRNSGSNLYLNQRAIFFTGTAEQSINSVGGETFDYVILDNGSNLNLLSNVTIKEKLEMVSGNITTNANILEIGTSTSDPGLLDYTSGMVLGTIKRWFAANTNSGDQTGIFPLGVGSDFRPVVVEYSTAPTVGGTLTASFVESSMGWQNSGSSPTIAAVGSCDAFSVTNYSDQGYWQIDDADGLSGGIYDISLYANGFTTINDICQLTALKRVGAGLWESVGQHQQPNATGDHGLQIKRRLVSGWSNWGLASGKDNILPVELIEFTHECYPNQTTILWTTASEKNNKHFEIEKSFDAFNWESIAKVDGAENSNTKIFYSFEDPASFHSDKIVYYRLKQTDFDGTYSYSNTISANCNSKIEPFSVYPNPNNGSFTITTSNPQNKIKIFDTSGKILFDKDNHEKYEIEIEGVDLKPGVYFLNIIFDNTTYTKKIVVSP